ncbi:MAG: sigma-70 family RNA polymerase sigma factor [Lutibacter sp.]|jgi:RNA polymerase sigma-70 factor (ECF subfamily)|nr:sigma-70 family RNA polymerase sigma factor [Lutibacter sp.]
MNFTDLCDEKQFDIFYKQEVNHVFRFILVKNKNKDEAFDIVQEAFIKIWENCNKFDLLKAKSYLFSVAKNLFLNAKKHEKVVRNFENNSTNLYIETETPESALREKEFKHKLEKAIGNLTDSSREVFLLNRIEGKKYKEIAELLGISLKAVEKRMSKALLALRSQIEEFN